MKKLELNQMENLEGGVNCGALLYGFGLGMCFVETGVGAAFAGACFIAMATTGCLD